jgi:hypothetical protein
MIRRLLGLRMLIPGAGLGMWVVDNLLIERLVREDMSPLPAIVFSTGLVYVGLQWFRRE